MNVRLDDDRRERLPAQIENRERNRLPRVVERGLATTSHKADLTGSTFGKLSESTLGRDTRRIYDTAASAVYDITCTCSVTSCTGNRAVTGSSCTSGTHPEIVEFKEFIRFIRISRDEEGFLFDTYA